MRKFFAIMLAMILCVACISGSVFAAPTTNLFLGDGSAQISATSDTIDVDIYFKAGGKFLADKEEYGDTMLLGALQIDFSATNSDCTSKVVTLSGLNGVAGTKSIVYSQKVAKGGNGYNYPTDAFKVGTLSLTRKNNAESSVITISGITLQDDYGTVYDDATYQETLTITWPSSAPEPVVIAAEANREVAGYTDVVNFSSVLTGVSGDNPTLTFDLYENGKFHKSYEESLGNGVTFDKNSGKLGFKIAILGAPTDTTITLVNPAVK